MLQLGARAEADRLSAFQQIIGACRKGGALETAALRISDDSRAIQRGEIIYNLPWDMEQCLTPYRLHPKDFRVSPNGDPEWCYMLSRMEYLRKLLWQAALTGETEPLNFYRRFVTEIWYPRYAIYRPSKKWHQLIFRARRKLRIPGPAALNRTLDVAVRAYALTVDQMMARTLSLPTFSEALRPLLQADIALMDRTDNTPFSQTSNIGIIVVCSRILCRLLWRESESIPALMQTLLARVSCQFDEHGAHLEDSPMYQVQVTLWLLRLIYWLRACGMEVPEPLTAAAVTSCSYLRALTGPDGFQQMIGDSDRTRMASFLSLAAWVLRDDSYALEASIPDDLSLFCDIPEALASALKRQTQIHRAPSDEWSLRLFSGTAVMRSENTMITCLNTRHASNHSHADSGSVLLYWRGAPLFVDCGRYSYVNCAARRRLKGPKSHNVLTFDNSPEWKVADAWVFKKKTFSPTLEGGRLNGFPVACMKWKGGSAAMARCVIALNGNILLLDGLRTRGTHTMKGYFHLSACAHAVKTSRRSALLRVNDASVSLTALGALSEENAIQSCVYQSLQTSQKLSYALPMRDVGWHITVLGESAEIIMGSGTATLIFPQKTARLTWNTDPERISCNEMTIDEIIE